MDAPPPKRETTDALGRPAAAGCPAPRGRTRYGAAPWERDVPEYEDHFRAGDWNRDGATHVRRDGKRVCPGKPRTGWRVGWARGKQIGLAPTIQHPQSMSEPLQTAGADGQRGVVIRTPRPSGNAAEELFGRTNQDDGGTLVESAIDTAG